MVIDNTLQITILKSISGKITYVQFFEYKFIFRLENGILFIDYASIDDEMLIKFLIDNKYAIITYKDIDKRYPSIIHYQLKLTNDLLLKLLD